MGNEPSLRSATGADGELVSGNWHSGNAEEDGCEYRGWILGHFVDPAEGVRSSKDVEVKWGIHPAGDRRAQWTADDQRTTLVFRVSGKFRIDLTEGSFTLERQGDCLVWGPGIDHSWEAVTDAVVVTVRWPSAASEGAQQPAGLVPRRGIRAAAMDHYDLAPVAQQCDSPTDGHP